MIDYAEGADPAAKYPSEQNGHHDEQQWQADRCRKSGGDSPRAEKRGEKDQWIEVEKDSHRILYLVKTPVLCSDKQEKEKQKQQYLNDYPCSFQ